MKTPAPQGYLSDDGKSIYDEIVKHLGDANALMNVDSHGLSMAAHWLDLYNINAAKTAENGGVQSYKTGATGVSASLTVMKTASIMFKDLSAKFGLSPKDRELMKQFKSERKEADELTNL